MNSKLAKMGVGFLLIMGIAAALGIITLLVKVKSIEGRVVPSGSMLPTIQVNDRVMVDKSAYLSNKPQRGDIIVFRPPLAANSGDYIHRAIGLPGETVEVKDGSVFVNNQRLSESYITKPPNYEFGPVTVPENCLFVLGDNRNSSYDSHLWNKWLTIDNVKGKAVYRYWPPERMGPIE
ncbi:MAG: signal peptidase I [Acidobacteriota bacterium]